MDAALRALLAEVYAFGQANDAGTSDRSKRMLNITPDTGEFLRALVIAGRFSRVLELGTSNGYSTLWFADACREVTGRVVTLDREAWKLDLARANLERGGLIAWADLRRSEIGEALRDGTLGGFDLVFLDCDREQYVEWWPALQRAVRPGGLLVVDNATSHEVEVRPLAEAIRNTKGSRPSSCRWGTGNWLCCGSSRTEHAWSPLVAEPARSGANE